MKFKKNLTLVSLVLGVMILVSLSVVSAATPTTLFSDGFESGNFNNWNEHDNDWYITTSGEHDGNYAALTYDSGSSDDLRVEISTVNYNNIVFSYWYRIYENIEHPENVVVQWSNNGGASWTDLVKYMNVNSGNWNFATFSLPSGATNNPNFQVRFRSDSLSSYDKFMLDDVKVTGYLMQEPQEPTCELIVDEPIAGKFYDPVKIGWHLVGEGCYPFRYTLQYKEGNCDPSGLWSTIGTSPFDPDQVGEPPSVDWYSLPTSGQYCVRVTADLTDCSPGCCVVTGYSGVWNLDLVAPEVHLFVGSPKVGECAEEQTGDCYVNTNTDITLTCSETPQENWQSGVDYIQYQIKGPQGVGSVQTVKGDQATFSFSEDSNHQVEYWCYDEVGKESEHKTKDLIVDTQAPTITRTVGNPNEEGTEGFEYYITTNTEICVSSTDPQPHPVDSVQLSCEYYWGDDSEEPYPGHGVYHVDLGAGGTGCFNYAQDSYHTLTCSATDALGNHAEMQWFDIVDTKAPITNLGYDSPLYTDGISVWINTASKVVLNAKDSIPHPVGLDKTYYRYKIVNNEYCLGGQNPDLIDWDEMIFQTYNEPFGIPEESCHAIEYYSVDKLGNEEIHQYEFVFADHTAPLLDFSVGQSGKDCDSLFVSCENDWDYKVTVDTPITISCKDQLPHPSGVQEICYTIFWDGSTSQPQEICEKSSSVTFKFTEPCEHRVEYTCKDNVEKTSSDSKVVKVIGEDFNIPLNKKWNLISVPVNLLSSNVGEVFSDISEDIEEVWSYEGGEWKVYYPDNEADSTLSTIVPGRGYWIKTNNPSDLLIGGSLFEEATLPNSVPLDEGWNLIGHYGITDREVYCSLLSLVDTTIGFPKWSAVVEYNSGSFIGLSSTSTMSAGKGYWIAMNSADNYNYATDCVTQTQIYE